MKKKTIVYLLSLFLFFIPSTMNAQKKKFDGKRIKEVKEWITEGKKRTLDQVTYYNEKGNKSEEIEYDRLGDQKRRTTYEYNDAGKCIKENRYDKYNKLEKVETYEYHENGKKKIQYNYTPNGKLKSTKEFEYILE